MSEQALMSFPTVVRRHLPLDAQAAWGGDGCPDCHVGEPHACPLLAWAEMVVTEDEYGSLSVETRPTTKGDSGATS